MRATSEQIDYGRTTEAILEETANCPLHLQPDRYYLHKAPVSRRSLWGDKRWQFDNSTSGSRKNNSTILWDLKLSDGKNLLDADHSDLLDWLRRLVWSAYAAPGDGASALKPGSLSMISSGLRYCASWLVEQEISWPSEINSNIIELYEHHLEETSVGAEETEGLTVKQAYTRLFPLALLWRQRFALERAGIAPMPAPPFSRAGVNKIAKKIAAIATGSFQPLPDEVAIPVLNKAMAMLGIPASDVIILAETCAAAYSLGLAESVGSSRKRLLAARRQLTAARAFQFTEVNGQPWHAPLDPKDWKPAMIDFIQGKLQHYLNVKKTEFQKQIGGKTSLPSYRYNGIDHVDVRKVALESGLKPGDEQFLRRHPSLNALLNNAALEQNFCSVPLIDCVHRARELILSICSAAHLVIQATTGMRISEICGLKAGINPATGLPSSVIIRKSLNGLSEIFILTSNLSKSEDPPRAVPWVLGYRPIGSTDLPPAVQAIVILDELLGPWRSLLGSDDLFVTCAARRRIPKTRNGVARITGDCLREGARKFIGEWVDLTDLPDQADRKTRDNELVTYRESHGRNIKTHQLRKSFGFFAANIDRRLLPMLQMNFHHVSAAMTDGAYTGNPILERDLNDVRYQNLALESLEIARGNSGLAGRYGEELERKIVGELGTRIRGLSAEDAYLEAFVYVEEARIDRLFFEPYGICGALSASEMACHETGGTTDIARWEPRLTPNYEARQPSLCAGCGCFAIALRHRPYWEMRYVDNAAQVRIFEALKQNGPLVDGALALTEAQARQAFAICQKLGSKMDELERRLATEVKETLRAA